jgi:predicted Zn-dependent protease
VAIANALGKSPRPSRYRAEEIKEADRVAIEMLARSAYDPRAAASAWRRLANLRTGIAQVAPVNDERLANIDAAARAAVPLYEEARKQAAANTPPPPPRGSQRPGPVLR